MAAFIVGEGFEVVVALLSGAEGLLLLALGLDQRGVGRLVDAGKDVRGILGKRFGVAAALKGCFAELAVCCWRSAPARKGVWDGCPFEKRCRGMDRAVIRALLSRSAWVLYGFQPEGVRLPRRPKFKGRR